MAADDHVTQLLRDAPLSFIGTVEHLGASTMADLPIDERTAVHVAQVLHAPEAFAHLAGHRVTMQLAADADPPKVGETSAFFAQGLAFGESVALSEIGRVPLQDVEPHVTAAPERGSAGRSTRSVAPARERTPPQHARTQTRSSWVVSYLRMRSDRRRRARPGLVEGHPAGRARRARQRAARGSRCCIRTASTCAGRQCPEAEGFAGGRVAPPRHGGQSARRRPLPDPASG